MTSVGLVIKAIVLESSSTRVEYIKRSCFSGSLSHRLPSVGKFFQGAAAHRSLLALGFLGVGEHGPRGAYHKHSLDRGRAVRVIGGALVKLELKEDHERFVIVSIYYWVPAADFQKGTARTGG